MTHLSVQGAGENVAWMDLRVHAPDAIQKVESRRPSTFRFTRLTCQALHSTVVGWNSAFFNSMGTQSPSDRCVCTLERE